MLPKCWRADTRTRSFVARMRCVPWRGMVSHAFICPKSSIPTSCPDILGIEVRNENPLSSLVASFGSDDPLVVDACRTALDVLFRHGLFMHWMIPLHSHRTLPELSDDRHQIVASRIISLVVSFLHRKDMMSGGARMLGRMANYGKFLHDPKSTED